MFRLAVVFKSTLKERSSSKWFLICNYAQESSQNGLKTDVSYDVRNPWRSWCARNTMKWSFMEAF